MPIVTIGGEKGGTGKSTLATNLAVEYARKNEGMAVALINSDPQNTAGNWGERRKAAAEERAFLVPVYCFSLFGKSIHKELADMATRYDMVIVDGAGRDAPELRSALLVSDLFVTPLRPSIADTETVETVERIVNAAQVYNEKLKATWIMNHVRQTSRDARRAEMMDAMGEYPVLVPLCTIITNLDTYQDALALGLGVSEMVKRSVRATTEMAFFYKEVTEWLRAPA